MAPKLTMSRAPTEITAGIELYQRMVSALCWCGEWCGVVWCGVVWYAGAGAGAGAGVEEGGEGIGWVGVWWGGDGMGDGVWWARLGWGRLGWD